MAEPRPLVVPETLALGLSFVSGYVDTFGFVALFQLFTAHVTGNFILIGTGFVATGPGLVAKFLALPVFMITVAAVCLMVRALECASHSMPIVILALQLTLLAAFMAAGLARAPFAHADDWDAVVTGLIGVAAMAVQNAGARLAFPTLVPTTVMTGNVTQFVIDIVDALRPVSSDLSAAARARLKRFTPPILSFSVGAIAGAVIYAKVSFSGLLLPLAILIALIVVVKRRG